MKVHRGEMLECPYCGHEMDAHARPEQSEDAPGPAEGDFSVCGECVGVLVFTEGGRALRKVTRADYEAASMETLWELRNNARLAAMLSREQS